MLQYSIIELAGIPPCIHSDKVFLEAQFKDKCWKFEVNQKAKEPFSHESGITEVK